MLYQNLTGRQPYGIQPSPRPRPRHKFVVALFVAISLVFGSHLVWSKHVSAETLAMQQEQARQAAIAKQKADVFASQVNTLIANNPNDTVGVAVATPTGPAQTYGATENFDGASVGKLLTAADFLHHVEQGSASLNQDIDGDTAGDWLQAMIVNSDDTAWEELNTYLTHEDLAAYAQAINFTNYDPDTNTFNAADAAVLLKQLYEGKLLNSVHRSLLMGYLARANYRQFIVAAVPSGNKVYHKVGWDDDTINDAAIITHGDKYVVLVIFTDGNGTYDTASRTQLMHTITQDATTAFL